MHETCTRCVRLESSGGGGGIFCLNIPSFASLKADVTFLVLLVSTAPALVCLFALPFPASTDWLTAFGHDSKGSWQAMGETTNFVPSCRQIFLSLSSTPPPLSFLSPFLNFIFFPILAMTSLQ